MGQNGNRKYQLSDMQSSFTGIPADGQQWCKNRTWQTSSPSQYLINLKNQPNNLTWKLINDKKFANCDIVVKSLDPTIKEIITKNKNIPWILKEHKKKFWDSYNTVWKDKIKNSKKLGYTYFKYKLQHCRESYLNFIKDPQLRAEFTKFRLSDHTLIWWRNLDTQNHQYRIMKDFANFAKTQLKTKNISYLNVTHIKTKEMLLTKKSVKKLKTTKHLARLTN